MSEPYVPTTGLGNDSDLWEVWLADGGNSARRISGPFLTRGDADRFARARAASIARAGDTAERVKVVRAR